MRTKPMRKTKAKKPARKSGLFAVTKDTNPKDAIGASKAPFSTVSAAVVSEIGLAMLEGALKYGRHNYRVFGVRSSVYYDAAKRHLESYWEGEDIDPDSKLLHLSKAMASLAVLLDATLSGMVNDDRPPRTLPKGWLRRRNAIAAKMIAAFKGDVRAPYTEVANPGRKRKVSV